jgi:hypothetical protein
VRPPIEDQTFIPEDYPNPIPETEETEKEKEEE